MKAVFGNAPDASIGGMTNSQMITQNLLAQPWVLLKISVLSKLVSNRDIVVKAQRMIYGHKQRGCHRRKRNAHL